MTHCYRKKGGNAMTLKKNAKRGKAKNMKKGGNKAKTVKKSIRRKRSNTKPHRRRTYRRYTRLHRGGSILPQPLTNLMRGSENTLVNTVNTFKGNYLQPSPYPTVQPIDQNVIVV